MIKQTQTQLLKLQKEGDTGAFLELQQRIILLNTLKRELSKNLRNRIII